MPQLLIRGAEIHKVKEISKPMIDELEKLLECPRSYFTIECISSVFTAEGEITEGYPFVEIAWFDRGQTLQDQTAEIVTRYMQSAGYQNVDVLFRLLEKEKYYENGKHF